MWLKKGLLALARLVIKGKRVEQQRMGLCGNCHYWLYGKCRSVAGCIFASGWGGPPIPQTTVGTYEKIRPAFDSSKDIPMDLSLWKRQEEVRAAPGMSRSRLFGSLLYAGQVLPITEEQKAILWNRHVVDCERQFEKLMELDLKRRAMQCLLDIYGVEYSQEFDPEVEVEVDPEHVNAEEVEEAVLLSEFMSVLTNAMKEFHDHGNEVHRRSVEGA